VLATRETLAVMTTRLGTPARLSTQAVAYGETIAIGRGGDVPAAVCSAAQSVIEEGRPRGGLRH
jgi:hypothetical protein